MPDTNASGADGTGLDRLLIALGIASERARRATAVSIRPGGTFAPIPPDMNHRAPAKATNPTLASAQTHTLQRLLSMVPFQCDMPWPMGGCDIRMFHMRPIGAGGRRRKNN